MNKVVAVNNRQITLKSGQVVMVPLAMVVPTAEGIYSIANYIQPFIISQRELGGYSEITMKVAPATDIYNWQYMTAYSKGLGGYYLAVA